MDGSVERGVVNASKGQCYVRSGCDLLGVWVISVMAEYLSGEGF